MKKSEMPRSEKDTVLRLFDEFYNRGNLDIADVLMSPDVIDYNPAPEQEPGIEGVKAAFASTRSKFPGIQAIVDDVVAEDDKVVVRFTLSSLQFTTTGMSMFQVSRGKIVAI